MLAADREMSRRLRKVLETDPDAFSRAMAKVQMAGAGWMSLFPRIPAGRVTREVLAMLLADYENRNAHGAPVSKSAWLKRRAEHGFKYGHTYGEYSWGTVDAIEAQLKNARRLLRADPDFKDEVDEFRREFLANGVGRW